MAILLKDPIQLLQISGLTKTELDKLPSSDKALYVYNDYAKTYEVPEDIWANELRTGKHYGIPFTVGGSDVGYLLDGSNFMRKYQYYTGQQASHYKTAFKLFCEKLGIEEKLSNASDGYVLFNGHAEEEAVAQKFVYIYQKDHPLHKVELINDTHMYRCGHEDENGNLAFPFALGDFDRFIVINGKKGILECKTCNFASPDAKIWKKGIVLLKYIVQVLYYMAIANVDYAYIVVSFGYAETDVHYYRFTRDLSIEADLMHMVSEFVGLCEDGTVPNVTTDDMRPIYKSMRQYYGGEKEEGNPISLSQDVLMDAYELMNIQKKRAELEEKKKELEKEKKAIELEEADVMSRILPLYGNASFATIPVCGGKSIKLTIPLAEKAASVDEKKVAEIFPQLYAEYSTKFNGTLFKKEHPIEFAACLKEKELSAVYDKTYTVEETED